MMTERKTEIGYYIFIGHNIRVGDIIFEQYKKYNIDKIEEFILPMKSEPYYIPDNINPYSICYRAYEKLDSPLYYDFPENFFNMFFITINNYRNKKIDKLL